MTWSARNVARSLSGYLCGTHSGFLAFRSSGKRRADAHSPNALAGAHRTLAASQKGRAALRIGERIWASDGDAGLARDLEAALAHEAVIDLVLFGSHATGDTTGFSDVDAILVIRDDAAETPEAMPSLRRSVLAAQRAVLRHQPMQHHGFEVVTPRLLRDASTALALPAVALSRTCSLRGMGMTAFVDDVRARDAAAALRAIAHAVGTYRTWPRHPWDVHRAIAMFELLPALYLQSRRKPVAKSESFAEARGHFEDWWPYDVLDEVRAVWPRVRRPTLELGAWVVRNPWVAVPVWRRLPVPTPEPIRSHMTPRLLQGLQTLATSMASSADRGE